MRLYRGFALGVRLRTWRGKRNEEDEAEEKRLGGSYMDSRKREREGVWHGWRALIKHGVGMYSLKHSFMHYAINALCH